MITEKEFERLFDTHYAKLVQNAMNILCKGEAQGNRSRHREDAEEIAADSFMALYQHREYIDAPMDYVYKVSEYISIKTKEDGKIYKLIDDWDDFERTHVKLDGVWYRKSRNEHSPN